jgi:hypothetical protein
MVARDDDAWLILSELRILHSQLIERLRIIAAAKLSGAEESAERRIETPNSTEGA